MTMRVTTGQPKAMIVQRLDLEAVSADGIQDQDAEVGAEVFASARVLCEHIDTRLAAAPAPLAAPAPREQGA